MSPAKRTAFLDSEEGKTIVAELEKMATGISYNTESTYSPDATRYPDGQISFVDKHINYIISHPTINPRHYIANLRIMTKIN